MTVKDRARHPLIQPIATTAIIFFVAEIAVMYMLTALPPTLSPLLQSLIDAGSLVTASLPFLLFLVIRPFYQVAITTGQKWEQLLEAAPEGILGYVQHAVQSRARKPAPRHVRPAGGPGRRARTIAFRSRARAGICSA